MLILGLTCGMDQVHETSYALHNKDIHDSSAVLLEDGIIIAAYEEERLDRIKHSNKFPVNAIRKCLIEGGKDFKEIDKIAIVNRRETNDKYAMWLHFTMRQNEQFLDAFGWVQYLIQSQFGEHFPISKIFFVGHHLAHATSAFVCSGYPKALVVTFDGAGDAESGSIYIGSQHGLRLLRDYTAGQSLDYTASQSLGVFYQRVSLYLGFDAFSEFKVMGLAPYGNASKYRRYFEACYKILPDGNYSIDINRLLPLLSKVRPRIPSDPIKQDHMDIAASLQEMLEKIVFSVLYNFRLKTDVKYLAFAGGLAHNCSLNGKILYSGLFDGVFVQPAAHDAGGALGAAYSVNGNEAAAVWSRHSFTTYLGSSIRPERSIFTGWESFINVRELDTEDELVTTAATLLASDFVIGWVQGRSEFGPRALGNRSILADPRPAINKDRINKMIKKREAFRPFAPAIIDDEVVNYFDIPSISCNLSFMTFVVKVKKDKQSLLGAITHIDGTARIQSVKEENNPLFWKLISAFGRVTGVPILLNTSFNNNEEPIVDSIADAIQGFLTTDLNYLFCGKYMISKRKPSYHSYLSLNLKLQSWVTLQQFYKRDKNGEFGISHAIVYQRSLPARWSEKEIYISAEIYAILVKSLNFSTLGEVFQELEITDVAQLELAIRELNKLWQLRCIILRPNINGPIR